MTIHLSEREYAKITGAKVQAREPGRPRVIRLIEPPESCVVDGVIRLVFPWPPREASPNARPHWRTKAKRVAGYREDCGHLAVKARRRFRGIVFPLDAPSVVAVFVTPTRQRHDLDNLQASIKAALDSLTDAGYWADDSVARRIESRREILPGVTRHVILEIRGGWAAVQGAEATQ